MKLSCEAIWPAIPGWVPRGRNSLERCHSQRGLGTRVEEEVQLNETMEDLNETRRELDQVKETLARTKEDRDMWDSLLEDCKRKQGQEIERLRQEYKERS